MNKYTATRHKKALKILAVLNQWYNGQLKDRVVLDVGCKTGEISADLSRYFKRVVGIDIDTKAINTAKQQSPFFFNLSFFNESALNLQFTSNFFDVVICNHVYEHVQDPQKMMDEIYRVLKPGGICYFAGINKITGVWHGKPKFLWQIRKMIKQFQATGYTRRIVENPELYDADDILNSPFKKVIARFWVSNFYWTFPVYIWVLKK